MTSLGGLGNRGPFNWNASLLELFHRRLGGGITLLRNYGGQVISIDNQL